MDTRTSQGITMPIKATIQRLLLKTDVAYIKVGNRTASFRNEAVMVQKLIEWNNSLANGHKFAYVLVNTEPLGQDEEIEFMN